MEFPTHQHPSRKKLVAKNNVQFIFTLTYVLSVCVVADVFHILMFYRHDNGTRPLDWYVAVGKHWDLIQTPCDLLDVNFELHSGRYAKYRKQNALMNTKLSFYLWICVARSRIKIQLSVFIVQTKSNCNGT